MYLRKPLKRNGLPQGVSVNSRNNLKYCSYIKYTSTGKKKNLGSAFCNPEEAFKVYKAEKVKDKAIMADRWLSEGKISEDVKKLLLNYEITS